MVSTMPPTPKAIAGHRRSRSQSSACSPSSAWGEIDPQHPFKSRAKRAQPFFSCHSDPVESHSYILPPSLVSGPIHPKCHTGILTRKSYKKSRKISTAFIRKQSRRSPIAGTHTSSNSVDTPFRLSASPQTVPSSRLASTPSAFQLSSTSRGENIKKPDCIPPSRAPREMQSEYREAFGHLRRSIEDGDQRFILRMQEWELQHTAPRIEPESSSEGSHLIQNRSVEPFDGLRFDDDEVEIIVHSDVSSYAAVGISADDLSDNMDQDVLPASVLQHKGSFSSFAEEDLTLDGSTSQYSSSNMSTGFPSSSSWDGLSSHSSIISLSPPGRFGQYPHSKSDRAIAALTLALANGAAGLQDYHTILQAQGTMSGCDAGGFWD